MQRCPVHQPCPVPGPEGDGCGSSTMLAGRGRQPQQGKLRGKRWCDQKERSFPLKLRGGNRPAPKSGQENRQNRGAGRWKMFYVNKDLFT